MVFKLLICFNLEHLVILKNFKYLDAALKSGLVIKNDLHIDSSSNKGEAFRMNSICISIKLAQFCKDNTFRLEYISTRDIVLIMSISLTLISRYLKFSLKIDAFKFEVLLSFFSIRVLQNNIKLLYVKERDSGALFKAVRDSF
jgi:hypothetical protein